MLNLIPICMEFHRLPGEVRRETAWDIEFMRTVLYAKSLKEKKPNGGR